MPQFLFKSYLHICINALHPMKEEFTASRLTEGNKIFPNKIIIDDFGVTLKIPGLFSGSEKVIPFQKISAVDVETPMVGYSTIIVETTGEGKVRAHGFTKSEVQRMKELILGKMGGTQ